MKTETIKKELMDFILGVIKWSFSAANEESACNLKRVFEKLHRDKPEVAKELGVAPFEGDFHAREVGSACHLFMERYEEYCYDNRVPQDQVYANKLKGKILAETELPVEMREDYEYIVDGLIKWRKFRMDVQSWSEQKVSFKVKDGRLVPCDFDDPAAVVRGLIDRVYRPLDESGTWVFTDYKTNRVQFGEDDKEKIKQQKFYAVLLDMMHPEYGISEKPVILCFDFLRMGKTTELYFDINKERDALIEEIIDYVYHFGMKVKNFKKKIKEMGETKEEILQYMTRFFKPKVNKYCSCDFFMSCPKYRDAMETMELEPEEVTSDQMKARKDALKKKHSVAEKHLKALYKAGGPVVDEDYIYGRYFKGKAAYDCGIFFENFKERLLELMGDENEKSAVGELVDQLKLMDIGVTAMKGAAKKSALINACSADAYYENPGHEWGWRRKDEKNVEWT